MYLRDKTDIRHNTCMYAAFHKAVGYKDTLQTRLMILTSFCSKFIMVYVHQ